MNKQKKLKLILSSLKEKQLIKFFETFLDTSKCKFYKSIKQISFSCFQSTCQIENYIVNGYGKTSSEALLSGINNLIDCLVEEEDHCEIMRQCLKKFNISPYGLTNNGTTSKKQLLSTQKTVKTLGPQTSMSMQKKILTMSASLSSNSKASSSKAKSIKDEIFEYFNLENLKVKNPSQAFTTVSPLAANNKIPKQIETIESNNLGRFKQKYGPNQVQQNSGSSMADKQLEQVYKRIREVKQQISAAEKQNLLLKQQVQNKKKVSFQNNEPNPANQYFTRPSLENKPNKKVNHSLNTQSSKKLSYLQMSLNDKLLIKNEKENMKKIKCDKTNENQFQNVEILNNFKTNIKGQESDNFTKSTTVQNGKMSNNFEQRKCLLDISNIKTGANDVYMGNKMNEYSTLDEITNKVAQTKHSAFQPLNNYLQNNERPNTNSILYAKASQQQQSMSIIESTKKLRCFSVHNSLIEKVNAYGADKCTAYGTNSKNLMTLVPESLANMNASFDNGGTCQIAQKKIKIPKLNLQILPNYHGRSNKSLNQSLMENYEKKGHLINPINE